MSMDFTEENIKMLLTAAPKSVFGRIAAEKIGVRFRSMHYKSSKLVFNGVILTLTLFKEQSIEATDKVVAYLHRSASGIYVNISSAYLGVKQDFDEYARTVIGSECDLLSRDAMRHAKYVIYVLACDLKNDFDTNKDELFRRAFSYSDYLKYISTSGEKE